MDANREGTMTATEYTVNREERIRTHSHGVVTVDAAGQAKTRPVLALRSPDGGLVRDYAIRERAKADRAARELATRDERIRREHLPGWVDCGCPACQGEV